jgi:hypothetical protein
VPGTGIHLNGTENGQYKKGKKTAVLDPEGLALFERCQGGLDRFTCGTVGGFIDDCVHHGLIPFILGVKMCVG